VNEIQFSSLPRKLRYAAILLESMAQRLRRDCAELMKLQNSFSSRLEFALKAEKFLQEDFRKKMIIQEEMSHFIDLDGPYIEKNKLKNNANQIRDALNKASVSDELSDLQKKYKNKMERNNKIFFQKDEMQQASAQSAEVFLDENGFDYAWMMPRIDGMENFVRGVQYFSITTGLWSQDKVIVAMVYDLSKGQLFWCSEKTGCFLDPQISLKSSLQKIPEKAIASLGNLATKENIMEILEKHRILFVMRQSPALEMVYTAAGLNDLCFMPLTDKDKKQNHCIGLFFLRCSQCEVIEQQSLIIAGNKSLISYFIKN
jgi:hypothetical protein